MNIGASATVGCQKDEGNLGGQIWSRDSKMQRSHDQSLAAQITDFNSLA